MHCTFSSCIHFHSSPLTSCCGSVGGTSMTIMLACISPSQTSVPETLRMFSRHIFDTEFQFELTLIVKVLSTMPHAPRTSRTNPSFSSILSRTSSKNSRWKFRRFAKRMHACATRLPSDRPAYPRHFRRRLRSLETSKVGSEFRNLKVLNLARVCQGQVGRTRMLADPPKR